MAICSAVMISTTFYRRFLQYLKAPSCRWQGGASHAKNIHHDDYNGDDDWIVWHKESLLPPNAHLYLINPSGHVALFEWHIQPRMKSLNSKGFDLHKKTRLKFVAVSPPDG